MAWVPLDVVIYMYNINGNNFDIETAFLHKRLEESFWYLCSEHLAVN